MPSFTSLLLVVACAALLQVGCEAQQHRIRYNNVHPKPGRRNYEDTSISLGTIKGQNMIALPVIHLSGPDVVVGFPDNCRGVGLELLGTEVIVTNSDGGIPVQLDADDANNPQSNVAIHCRRESWYFRCPKGVDVKSYQICGNPFPRSTSTPAPTTPIPTTGSPSSDSDSSSSSLSSSEE